MSRRDTGTRLKEWNGHVIMVTDGGKFYTESDTEQGGRLEADSLDALKKKIGKDTVFDPPIAAVEFRWQNDTANPLEVVKVTGAGNIMIRDWKGRPERKDRYSALYVRDDARMAERAGLLKEERRVKRALEKLINDWPKIDRANAAEIAKNPPPAWTEAEKETMHEANRRHENDDD